MIEEAWTWWASGGWPVMIATLVMVTYLLIWGLVWVAVQRLRRMVITRRLGMKS